jgi:hypothetical protein
MAPGVEPASLPLCDQLVVFVMRRAMGRCWVGAEWMAVVIGWLAKVGWLVVVSGW